jgi:hypothetical protein
MRPDLVNWFRLNSKQFFISIAMIAEIEQGIPDRTR